MLHQPFGGVGGTSEDIALQAKEILVLKDITTKIMSECTGQPLEKITQDSDRDFFMSAQEAIKYGIIDKIAEPPTKK
jgi:ATP-dependent Clp protease protease subunit